MYRLKTQIDVATFHHSFGMPDLLGKPEAGLIPQNRVELRVSLINEEGIIELGEAIRNSDYVGAIDALIDTVYVVAGAAVEAGIVLEEVKPCNFTSHKEYRTWLIGEMNNLNQAISDRNKEALKLSLETIAANAWQRVLDAGFDPVPFWDEVQRSNMSKLGADGKPIYSRGVQLDGYPEGKVLKGPNYSPPNLKAIFDEQLTRSMALRLK